MTEVDLSNMAEEITVENLWLQAQDMRHHTAMAYLEAVRSGDLDALHEHRTLYVVLCRELAGQFGEHWTQTADSELTLCAIEHPELSAAANIAMFSDMDKKTRRQIARVSFAALDIAYNRNKPQETELVKLTRNQYKVKPKQDLAAPL